MARLTIDPMTRIEGHLKLDVEIEGGKVKDAWTSGTLFRGFRNYFAGKGPEGCMASYTEDLRRMSHISWTCIFHEHG